MSRSNQPNIFILSVDSLTANAYKKFFQSIFSSIPVVEFEAAYATASNTNSSIPALAAGVYADRLSDVGLPLAGNPKPIAELLTESGYSCGLWTDNFLFGEAYNYDRGFSGGNIGKISWKRRVARVLEEQPIDFLYDIGEWTYFTIVSNVLDRIGQSGNFWKSAEQFHEEALSWLSESNGEPIFCWIHYMDVHHPYDPPQSLMDSTEFNKDWERNELAQFTRETARSDGTGRTQEEISDVLTAYNLTCEYLASRIETFVSSLREGGHYDPDRDILVFTADHGESFRSNPGDQMGHKSIWEEVVNVPLVISAPTWSEDQIKEQVSLIDLMPTLLSFADEPVPDSAEGVGCESPEMMIRDQVFFCNAQPWFRTRRGIRTKDGWKLFGHKAKEDKYSIILSKIGGDNEKIYYKSDDDSVQSRDGDINKRWSTLLESLEVEVGPPLQETEKFEMNEQVQDHLENLGYLE